MSKNSRRSSCQRDSDGTDAARTWRYRTVLAEQIALATSGAVHIRLLGTRLVCDASAPAPEGLPWPEQNYDRRSAQPVVPITPVCDASAPAPDGLPWPGELTPGMGMDCHHIEFGHYCGGDSRRDDALWPSLLSGLLRCVGRGFLGDACGAGPPFS
jgi:hypothetical protein